MPNIVLDASALAQLIQIAAQLYQQVEAIRASNPDAWAQVEQDYNEAVASWNAAVAVGPVAGMAHPAVTEVIQAASGTHPDSAKNVPSQEPIAQPLPVVQIDAGDPVSHYNDARQASVKVSVSEGVRQDG